MTIIVDAEPHPVGIELGRTALVIIDMQRDFLEPDGFGAALGNDVSRLSGRRPALPGGSGGGARRRPVRLSTPAKAIGPTSPTHPG